MEKIIVADGIEIFFTLERKSVKNINLRINSDGDVFVSAGRRVPERVIEAFVAKKAGFILKAREKLINDAKKSKVQYFTENEIKTVISELCSSVFPYYEKRGIKYPVIKFRKMVSQWGNCYPSNGVLTFNTNLMYAPIECVEYVVWHEFTHFLQANHSEKFYKELSLVCPEWKNSRKKLRDIKIR